MIRRTKAAATPGNTRSIQDAVTVAIGVPLGRLRESPGMNLRPRLSAGGRGFAAMAPKTVGTTLALPPGWSSSRSDRCLAIRGERSA